MSLDVVDTPLVGMDVLRLVLQRRRKRKKPPAPPSQALDLTPVVERLDRMNATLEKSYGTVRQPVSS